MATVMTEELRVRRRRPVEGKVIAGAAGAGLAAPLTGLVLWLLEEYALHAPVPGPLELFVLAVVPLVVAYVAAWSAPHTPRPDLVEPEPAAGEGESLWARMMEAGKAAPPVFHIHPADPIVVKVEDKALDVNWRPEGYDPLEHMRSERERRRVTGEPAESSTPPPGPARPHWPEGHEPVG
jgi:hypothetical protein